MRFPTLHGIIWNLTRNEAGRRKAAFGVIDDVIGLDSKRFEGVPPRFDLKAGLTRRGQDARHSRVRKTKATLIYRSTLH
jgi:hypothetical protein